jgi:hypothetical protein
MIAVALPLPAEWAGSVIMDLPSSKPEVHASVMPDVLRVMAKGAKVSITHRDKDIDTKAWLDRLVFAGFVDVKEVSCSMCNTCFCSTRATDEMCRRGQQTAHGRLRLASLSGRLARPFHCL